MSGRQFKNDLSDVVGILLERDEQGIPIRYEQIEQASDDLYGGINALPESSQEFINNVFKTQNYKELYSKFRSEEVDARSVAIEFTRKYPQAANEENITELLKRVRGKKESNPR